MGEPPSNQADERRVQWAELPDGAKAFRVAHVVFGVVNLAGLGYVWLSALRRTRDRWLAASAALLAAEGIALVIGRGNCPFGPFQRSLGDPVPMFELVLPPKAAKAAVPILTAISLAGFAAVLLRPGRGPSRARFASAGGIRARALAHRQPPVPDRVPSRHRVRESP